MNSATPTTYKPEMRFVKDQDPTNKTVRVFTNYDTVALQIWIGRRYMMVNLTLDEARSIGGDLATAADEIWGRS